MLKVQDTSILTKFFERQLYLLRKARKYMFWKFKQNYLAINGAFHSKILGRHSQTSQLQDPIVGFINKKLKW